MVPATSRVILATLATLAMLAMFTVPAEAEWPCVRSDKYWAGLGAAGVAQGPVCVRAFAANDTMFPVLKPGGRSFATSVSELCALSLFGGQQLMLPGFATSGTGAQFPAWVARWVLNVTSAKDLLVVPTGAVLQADGKQWQWPPNVDGRRKNGSVSPIALTVAPRVTLPAGGSAADYTLVLLLNVTAGTVKARLAPWHWRTLDAAVATSRGRVHVLCQGKAPRPCPQGFLLHAADPTLNPTTEALGALTAVTCLGAGVQAPPSLDDPATGALTACTAGGTRSGARLVALPSLGPNGDRDVRAVLAAAGSSVSGGQSLWWTGGRGAPDPTGADVLQLQWDASSPVQGAALLPGFAAAKQAIAAGVCAAADFAVAATYPGLDLQVLPTGGCASALNATGPPATLVGGWLCQWDQRLQLQATEAGHWDVGFLVATMNGWGPTYVCTVDFPSASGAVACREMGYDTGLVVTMYYNNDRGPRVIVGRQCAGWETNLDQCRPDLGPAILSPAATSTSAVPCRGHDAVALMCYMNLAI